MIYTLHIDDSNPKAQAFLEYIKSLDFISMRGNVDFPSMTDQQIIDQAIIAEKEIKEGKTISHDQVLKEFKKW